MLFVSGPAWYNLLKQIFQTSTALGKQERLWENPDAERNTDVNAKQFTLEEMTSQRMPMLKEDSGEADDFMAIENNTGDIFVAVFLASDEKFFYDRMLIEEEQFNNLRWRKYVVLKKF